MDEKADKNCPFCPKHEKQSRFKSLESNFDNTKDHNHKADWLKAYPLPKKAKDNYDFLDETRNVLYGNKGNSTKIEKDIQKEKGIVMPPNKSEDFNSVKNIFNRVNNIYAQENVNHGKKIEISGDLDH